MLHLGASVSLADQPRLVLRAWRSMVRRWLWLGLRQVVPVLPSGALTGQVVRRTDETVWMGHWPGPSQRQ